MSKHRLRISANRGSRASDKRPADTARQKDKSLCHAKSICLELQKDYGTGLLPVCPKLKKLVYSPELYTLKAADTNQPPIIQSIKRITGVCALLAHLKPDAETVVWCAHQDNLLTRWIDPVREDLNALSLWLEKDFPETSKECREVVAELQLAEMRYTMNSGGLVYLLPPNLEHGNWASFLEWRKRQAARWGESLSSAQMDFMRFSNPYPGEGVKVARKMIDKLHPLINTIGQKYEIDMVFPVAEPMGKTVLD